MTRSVTIGILCAVSLVVLYWVMQLHLLTVVHELLWNYSLTGNPFCHEWGCYTPSLTTTDTP